MVGLAALDPPYFYCGPSKRPGRSWSSVASWTLLASSESTITIGRLGANSARNWRQAPQGVTPPRLATAIATNSFSPAATAAPAATRSAQFVRPKEAFSTLTPTKILPLAVRSAAPTGKLEYGQYASRCAWSAAPINSSRNDLSML